MWKQAAVKAGHEEKMRERAQVASRNDQGPQTATVGIEVVTPDGPLAASYRFPARNPAHRPQPPFQLTAYGAGQALANTVAVVRPFAYTGSGQVFNAEWRPMAEMQPFLATV